MDDLRERIARALYVHGISDHQGVTAAEILGVCESAADAVIAALPPVTGDTSDGYHTFDELYEYRMLYNAAFVNSTSLPVVKSWRHSDGEPCFGGGWFVVVVTLPTGQVSNHYKAEHWDLFCVPEGTPPEYDGHTPQDAAARLARWLERTDG